MSSASGMGHQINRYVAFGDVTAFIALRHSRDLVEHQLHYVLELAA